MNKLFLISALIFLAAGCSKTPPTVTIGNNSINVEVADTESARTQGLSGRLMLGQDSGMLFVFDSADKHSFWMKGMRFALDFIWIKDNKVVEITYSVQPQRGTPDGSLQIFKPAGTIDSMLEVNAGWAGEKGIKVGDRVRVDR